MKRQARLGGVRYVLAIAPLLSGGCVVVIDGFDFEPSHEGRALANIADAPDKSDGVRIADVAWIAGRWGTEMNGSQLDELWSEPMGDTIMGMFRWLKGGKVWIYELLTIREEAGTLVLRFRHFSDTLETWEEKTKPITYHLVSCDHREAIFENPDSESYRRFAFERSDARTLIIRVGSIKDGKLHVREFRYDRK